MFPTCTSAVVMVFDAGHESGSLDAQILDASRIKRGRCKGIEHRLVQLPVLLVDGLQVSG